MKELVVRKVGIASLGKLIGTWAAIVGLVFGVIGAISTVVAVVANNDLSVLQDVLYSILALAVGIIVVPLFWFALGWLQGAILAVIFNVVVAGSGGLAIDVEENDLVIAKK